MIESDPRSATEIELLRSRMVLGQAVADQNLDWRVNPTLFPVIGTMLSRYNLPVISALVPQRFTRPGDRLTLEHLVVPPHWLNEEIRLQVLDDQCFELSLPDGDTVEGTVGTRLGYSGNTTDR